MSSALLDSLELPHWLILAGILLLIAGVIGLMIDRKRLQKVDAPNENSEAKKESSAARPQLPPLPDLLDSRPRRERRQAEADGDLETKGKPE
jgi:hypothetical protein